jgi:hypothetical protein
MLKVHQFWWTLLFLNYLITTKGEFTMRWTTKPELEKEAAAAKAKSKPAPKKAPAATPKKETAKKDAAKTTPKSKKD